MDGTEINSNQMIDKIERDEQGQDQEQLQSMPHETEEDTTIVIKNDQTTAREIGDQPNQDEEKTNNFLNGERWDLRNPEKNEEMINQPIDDLLSRNQAQMLSISNGVILDGEEEKIILENSMSTFCSVCKTRRPNIGWKKEFSYEELQAATDAFSLKNCLSESGSLFTFQGQMEGGMKLVVKQHDVRNTQVREKVNSGMQTILKARHKNVIMLFGSSTAECFLFTVYEYACNGSLDKYLSKEGSRPLTWIERKRVAIGIARGLKYLHENNIVHCNIKPSNILLTHDFKPMIGDFGYGKELDLKSYKNKNKGNCKYAAPEYQEKRKFSTKTDVYSFGVVILELITGRRTTDLMLEDKCLVEWAKPLLKRKKYSELVDPIIRNSYEEEHLRWLVQVTTQCLKKNPKERLSMNMVVSALQGIAESETCHMTEDITPAISDSTIVPDINGSQGPTTTKADEQSQEEEKIKSRFHAEEKKLRLIIENNHFYSDKLGQIEEQMQRRPQGEEKSSGKLIINDRMMDQTVVNQLSEFEEQMPSTFHREGITTQKISVNHMISPTKGDQLSQDQEEEINFIEMKIGLIPEPISGMIDQTKADQLVQDKTQTQRRCHDDLLDERQGEIILENSKSSACSICKSRRPNNAWTKDFNYEELLEATEGFSIENSLSEREDGPTFEGLLERQIGDFDFGKVKHGPKKSSKDKSVRNSGYAAPEYVENGKVSNKTDVYSFGVVLLELISGRRATDKLPGGKSLVDWARPLLGGKKYPKLVDLKISNSYEEEKLLWLVQVTEQCLRKNPKERITMNMVSLSDVEYDQKVHKTEKKACYFIQSRSSVASCIKTMDFVNVMIKKTNHLERLNLLGELSRIVVSSLQGIEESAEYSVIEDSPPENSCLPHDEPAMISTQGNLGNLARGPRHVDKSQNKTYGRLEGINNNQMLGQMKADPVKQEQEWIGRNQYEEERSLRLTVITNDIIGQRNADQLIQGGEDVQSSPHEEMSRVTVISNDVIDEKNSNQKIQEKLQIKGSCDEGLKNANEAKVILENSKSSVCSICRSRRPYSGLQKKYTYEELEAATEGFSIKYSLCEGEYGPAFRGQLENNQEIVIKQHTFTSLQEQKVFISEFQLLINARHENVIMLLGSCIRLSQLLIVYEKACNGSLDQYLSRQSATSLTWGERVKVAIGVARGLKYLHENNIVHGGIKPSNILLNHEFKPMVGDFVFGKERCELKNVCKQKSIRNCGYTAPECQESEELSTEADVYSFGVVLVRSLLGRREYRQLVDPKVRSSYDEQELVSLFHITENCLKKNPKERFTMNMVVSALPCVANSNGLYVKEDFSPENSNVSDAKNSKGEEESLKENNLGTENTEEVRMNHREGEKEESLEEEDLDTENSEKVRRNHKEGEKEETLEEEEDLGTENREERVEQITCSRGNNEPEVSQECDTYTKCGEISKKTEEKEGSSTKLCQKWEGCLSYGGARKFYHQGAQEYTACKEFFGCVLELKLVSSTTLSFSLLRPRSLHFSLKFHASFSLKSPTSTFRAFSNADEDEEDDEEEDQDQDNVSADEYDDVLGEASDEADVFAWHSGFKWQRVDKLCNEVREFGADLIDVDELTSVYDFRIDKFQRQAILVFLRGFSVVVSAPTSSEKTLIAEAAVECEYLLTTAFHVVLVIYCPKEVQLICLSATIANPNELAGWIGQDRLRKSMTF
ncbi:hypothetical protein JHK85_056141 [Glycine max]|nr:hypothetical protein JHK85_056141 [Glycine max]